MDTPKSPRRGTPGTEEPAKEQVLRGTRSRLASGGLMQHTQRHQAMDDAELAMVCLKVREAIALREKYRMPAEREPPGVGGPIQASRAPRPVRGWPFVAPPWEGERGFQFELQHGVMRVWREEASPESSPKRRGFLPASRPAIFEEPPSIAAFTADLERLLQLCADATVNSFCYKRLQKLEADFGMHVMENGAAEVQEQQAVPHRDFYNIRKVDSLALDAAANQKHLLRFIKKKMKVQPHEVVLEEGGRKLTLTQVFEEMGLDPYDLNLDALGMQGSGADGTFVGFDKFNLKYNPMGKSLIGRVFLRMENELHGRYFAELTRELFDNLEESKYQNTEYRLSIFGVDRDECDRLSLTRNLSLRASPRPWP